MKIIIPGKPIAKKRPRFARRGKFTVTYSDQQTEEGKSLLLIREQWRTSPLSGPISLRINFHMPRPSSHWGTGKNSTSLKLSAPMHHTKKPDVDNLEKFIADICTGVVWNDDCQVVESITRKFYSDCPRTEIFIEEVDE